MKRKYYIDNLRWLCILILLPFHTAMAWNTWESNYIKLGESKLLSTFVMLVVPSYMPLLFVLAGMSMKFSLSRRTDKEFLIERLKKLLLPLLAGILTVVAVMTYYADCFFNHYQGSFFSHYRVLLGSVSDFTGYDGKFTPGHLWFMLFLFLSSLLLFGVIKIQRKVRPDLNFKSMKTWQLLLLGIIPLIFFPLLDMGGGKSIGESFAFVALGYYIFSEDENVDKIAGIYIPLLVITLLCSGISTYFFLWNSGQDMLFTIPYRFARWFGILGFLGLAQKKFDYSNRITKYFTPRSFQIYIFHFMWIVIIQYYLAPYHLGTAAIYIITTVGATALTLVTVELVRRLPVLRSIF